MHSPIPFSWSVRWVIIAMVVLNVASCKKESDDDPVVPQPPAVHGLVIEHHVDGAAAVLDAMNYITESGTTYSISRLNYYISGIVLQGMNGTANDTIKGPYYIGDQGTTRFTLGTLQAGEYSGAGLFLGLPPDLNVTGGLPNTMENVNMAWPDPMGGGYHFLKLEGHFDSGISTPGFAMHVGNSAYLAQVVIAQPFTITSGSGDLVLRFNLNEIFRTPHTYDLANGNYSMGSATLMGQLRDNAADAFSIEYRP
ncbi:MAG: hypothetical protein IPI81_07235 [Flavobacteriales bacterium]|nr:hypothetical protein [Flavobacteriales bacterium]MCC6938172.1 hypothetical protein [Flavobacteriales bacterium]